MGSPISQITGEIFPQNVGKKTVKHAGTNNTTHYKM